VGGQRVASPQAPSRLVEQQRHVGEEVTAGELELDDGAVALAARVAAGADRTEVAPVGHLDKAEAIEQLAEERDAGHAGQIGLARLHGDPTQRPDDDTVLDLEERRGSPHRTGAPLLGSRCAFASCILPGGGAFVASFGDVCRYFTEISGSDATCQPTIMHLVASTRETVGGHEILPVGGHGTPR